LGEQGTNKSRPGARFDERVLEHLLDRRDSSHSLSTPRGSPDGKSTPHRDRPALAKAHQADLCCPLTTDILAVIAANADEEVGISRRHRITPWWRTLNGNGRLQPKFPGGLGTPRLLLEAEGDRIAGQGQSLRVENWEKRLESLKCQSTTPASQWSVEQRDQPESQSGDQCGHRDRQHPGPDNTASDSPPDC
jgi:hypothetical protein